MKLHKKIILSSLLIGLFLTGCTTAPSIEEVAAEIPVTGNEEESMSEDTEANLEDEAMTEEDPKPVFSVAPSDPPDALRTLADSDSSLRAYENRVLSGDNFLTNLYERPFTSQEMIYQPDLDIQTVDFAEDDNFFYFTITLFDLDPDTGSLNGLYGIEFDRTLTGRGDLFVLTESPGGDWTAENVTVFTDENSDVGGPQPLIPDTGFSGSGYDAQETLGGEAAAFSRIAPNDDSAVQVAVSKALLGNPEEFTWGAWADNGLRDFTLYDYHDFFGMSEAGSPFRENEDYPIDALYSVDNTCRLPYGQPQIGSTIPGVCISIPPAPKSEEKAPGRACPPGYVLVTGQCVPIN